MGCESRRPYTFQPEKNGQASSICRTSTAGTQKLTEGLVPPRFGQVSSFLLFVTFIIRNQKLCVLGLKNLSITRVKGACETRRDLVFQKARRGWMDHIHQRTCSAMFPSWPGFAQQARWTDLAWGPKSPHKGRQVNDITELRGFVFPMMTHAPGGDNLIDAYDQVQMENGYQIHIHTGRGDEQ